MRENVGQECLLCKGIQHMHTGAYESCYANIATLRIGYMGYKALEWLGNLPECWWCMHDCGTPEMLASRVAKHFA